MKKKGSSGGSRGHSHGHHEHHSSSTHGKKPGNPAHDTNGLHRIGWNHHRLNVGAHRFSYIHKPCKNRHCKSYGGSHPNCKCYAKGGVVDHFCASDQGHVAGCEYYSQGGQVKVKENLKGLNLANFKKIKEDKKTVTMGHPSGHTITIAKAAVSSLQKKQLEMLPLHLAEGTDEPIEVPARDTSEDQSPAAPESSPESVSAEGAAPDTSIMDSAKGIENGSIVPQLEGATNPEPAKDTSTNDIIGTNSVTNPNDRGPASLPSIPGQVPNDQTANISPSSIYQKELGGIREKQKAETELAQSNAAIEKQQQLNIQAAQKHWEDTSAVMQKNIGDALNDIKNGHINPKHYEESMGTGQKVATAIGLLLGGFSGGFNRTGVNPAAQWLTEQINRDIDSQKVNLNNKATLYSAYLDQYKNASVADQMARATQLGIYASKLREAGAKAGTPMAKANADIAASELERNILPVIQNAHLTNQFAQFNSGAQGNGSHHLGSESLYKVALDSAFKINPTLYKDQQDKYIPGLGVASHPIAQADRERVSDLDSLLPLIDNAIADQKKYGMTGATLSMHPIKNRADAMADENALQVKLNKLTALNRLNDREYQNYGQQIGQVGQMNLGGTLETLTKLKSQAVMDRNSAITSMGLKPFSDAVTPSGLNGPQQQNLDIFLKKNPKVDPGTAKDILREKGLL